MRTLVELAASIASVCSRMHPELSIELQVSFSKRGGACMKFPQPGQNCRVGLVPSSHRATQSAAHSRQTIPIISQGLWQSQEHLAMLKLRTTLTYPSLCLKPVMIGHAVQLVHAHALQQESHLHGNLLQSVKTPAL